MGIEEIEAPAESPQYPIEQCAKSNLSMWFSGRPILWFIPTAVTCVQYKLELCLESKTSHWPNDELYQSFYSVVLFLFSLCLFVNNRPFLSWLGVTDTCFWCFGLSHVPADCSLWSQPLTLCTPKRAEETNQSSCILFLYWYLCWSSWIINRFLKGGTQPHLTFTACPLKSEE